MEFGPKSTNKKEEIKNLEGGDFELLLNSLKNNEHIEMSPSEKLAFLKWCVTEKNYLLHGSNINNIKELQPNLANCSSKEFGNQNAVFANEDPNITMFYALKNKDFEGIAESGISTNPDSSEIKYIFNFRTENPTQDYCLADGSIYLLNRDSFNQGTNNVNEYIDEWASSEVVIPQAKIDINVEDFPYLSNIKYIKEIF